MEQQQSLNVEEGEDDFEQRMLKKIREVLSTLFENVIIFLEKKKGGDEE